MARRNGTSDAFAGVLVAVGLAGLALLFLFLLIATVAVYALPVVWFCAFIWLRSVEKSPPAIQEAAEFDSLPGTVAVARALVLRNQIAAEHAELYEAGAGAGIYLTKGSNETRFDTRSRLGRELNEKLGRAEDEFQEISNNIHAVRERIFMELPNWRAPFDKWIKLRAIQISLYYAMATLLISAAALYITPILSNDTLAGFQKMLIWNPFPQIQLGGLVISALLSYAAFIATFFYQRSFLSNLMPAHIAEAWRLLEGKWSPHVDPDGYFPILDDDNKSGEDEKATDANWHVVLGVSRDASPDEIKTAYRNGMKSYHSDRVAGLGAKLRELAEEESKRLNIAYEQARKVRGFR